MMIFDDLLNEKERVFVRLALQLPDPKGLLGVSSFFSLTS